MASRRKPVHLNFERAQAMLEEARRMGNDDAIALAKFFYHEASKPRGWQKVKLMVDQCISSLGWRR